MCGIFGFVGTAEKKKADFTDFNLGLLGEINTRGKHASGYFADGKIVKKQIPSTELVKLAQTEKDFRGAGVIMGHARYAAHGSPRNMKNNHPHTSGRFVLVHNGVILTKPAGIHLDTECDSEVLVKVIKKAGGVKEAYWDLLGLTGSFAILC